MPPNSGCISLCLCVRWAVTILGFDSVVTARHSSIIAVTTTPTFAIENSRNRPIARFISKLQVRPHPPLVMLT